MLDVRWLLLTLIRIYQLCFHTLIGPCCRFYPSCSEYAHTAIERFGIGYGVFLMVRRLVRCHPWHLGGVDEVPLDRGVLRARWRARRNAQRLKRSKIRRG